MAIAFQKLMERPTVIKGSKQTKNHSYTCSIDTINRRLIIHRYWWKDAAPFVAELFDLCRNHEFGKLIVQAREQDWQSFLKLGFVMEGTIPSFFQGEPVYYMSKFFDAKRQLSRHWQEAEEILEKVILHKQSTKRRELPPDLTLEVGTEKHVPELVRLFTRVFDTYPSPLTDPEYLAKSMQNDIFVLIRDGKKRIVSAAGAEIDRMAGNAEMTNCATLPEYRGYGLMSHLFVKLEQELAEQGIKSLFSIARAKSFGMNRVLHEMGYTYRGRLINNCDICGGLEDMNLWSKGGAASCS